MTAVCKFRTYYRLGLRDRLGEEDARLKGRGRVRDVDRSQPTTTPRDENKFLKNERLVRVEGNTWKPVECFWTSIGDHFRNHERSDDRRKHPSIELRGNC